MPLTVRQWEESLRQPALCELLPVRDYLDNCIVRTNGSFVAGYETTGLNTNFDQILQFAAELLGLPAPRRSQLIVGQTR